MSLRETVRTISRTTYMTRLVLYRITRILGSKWMLAPIVAIGGMSLSNPQFQTQDQLEFEEFTLFFVVLVWLASKIFYPQLKPGDPPPRYQAPTPPPPPPRATTASGRTDDPDEATVIGGLDPKLRDLLRQKTGGKPS